MVEEVVEWLHLDVVVGPADGKTVCGGEDRAEFPGGDIGHFGDGAGIPFLL